MGEEITLNAIAIRSLQNSNQFNQPDTYLGTYWASTSGSDNGGVHTNSGVINYWYYLVSQGGNGTNDIGHAFAVGGVGIDHAQQIAFRTELLYLTSSANYLAARNGSIQATRDLYGLNSCEEISVTNAWYAVGVGAAYSGNAGLIISGDNSFCTTSNPYSILNLPSGAPVTWSASPSNLVQLSCSTCVQTTATGSGTGTFTLTATVATCAGQAPVTVTKSNIKVGAPDISTYKVIGAGTVYADAGYYYSVSYPLSAPPPVNITWGVPTGWTITNGQGTDNISIWTGSTGGIVSIDFTNACGEPTGTYKTVVIGTGGPAPLGVSTLKVAVSPNPATNNVTISLQSSETNTKQSTRNFISEIKIIDKMGVERKQFI